MERGVDWNLVLGIGIVLSFALLFFVSSNSDISNITGNAVKVNAADYSFCKSSCLKDFCKEMTPKAYKSCIARKNSVCKRECINVARLNVSCTDSDQGVNKYYPGNVSGGSYGVIGFSHATFFDYCIYGNPNNPDRSTDLVIEYYCAGNYVQFQEFNCPLGCANGACLRPTIKVARNTN